MDLYTGARVKLTLRDKDVLLGFINTINTNENDSVLVLDKVEIWLQGKASTKTRLPGIQRVHGSEIEDVEILPETQQKITTQNNSKREKPRTANIQRAKHKPKHLKNLVELDPEKLVFGKTGDGGEDLVQVFKEGRSSDYDSGSEAEDSYTTDDFTVLTKVDDLFNEAVQFIKSKPVIGFAAEGVEIGREGELCWIQIDASGYIFLFDMVRLGEEGFHGGLKDIIESQSILKIIHDCRLISDLLHHQYKIKMLNIFDTQVAHVFAYQAQNHKDLPRYVPGLASCLYEHLDLPNDQVHIMRIREQAKKEDQKIWGERPAARCILEAAAKHVKHLTELRIVLMEKMMIEFIAGVEIYLTYVRSSSDKEARESLSKRHLLPLAFQHMNRFVSDLQKRMRLNGMKFHGMPGRDENGFTEVSQRIMDPEVVPSRDSPWHVNTGRSIPRKYPQTRDRKTDESSPEKSKPNKTQSPSKIAGENQRNTSTTSPPPSPCAELDAETSVSDLSDAQFVQKITSQVAVTENSPDTRHVFNSIRREETENSTSNSLEGFTLIPAGFVQNNISKKSKQAMDELSPTDIIMGSVVSYEDNDSRDYGEIPTPKTLRRSAVSDSGMSVVTSPSSFSDDSSTCSEKSSNTSKGSSNRLALIRALEKTKKTESLNPVVNTNNTDVISEHTMPHLSPMGGSKTPEPKSESNLAQVGTKSSPTSESSSYSKQSTPPGSSRLHKLMQILNQEKSGCKE